MEKRIKAIRELTEANDHSGALHFIAEHFTADEELKARAKAIRSTHHKIGHLTDTVASERAELEKEIFASIAKRSTHLLRMIKKAL